MMKGGHNLEILLNSALVSPLIGLSTIALEKGISRFGHPLLQIGAKSNLFLGIVGTVNALAASIFFVMFSNSYSGPHGEYKFKMISAKVLGSLIIANLAIVVPLSVLAAKVNLLSAPLTYPGAILLAAANGGMWLSWVKWNWGKLIF